MCLRESLFVTGGASKRGNTVFSLSHHSEKSREGFVLLQLVGFGFPAVLSLTGGGKVPAHLSNGQLV